MAVLRSGILGRASGKVAGVVGAHWKSQSYIREYVVPANPNTTLQQTQRTKMRYAVRFLKPLVGQVFNKYMDKFQKSMSGFNAAISANIAYCAGPVAYSSIKLTLGKLFHALVSSAVYATGNVTISWSGGVLGSNGAASDKVFAVIYDAENDLWYPAGAEVRRDANQIIINIGSGLTASNLKCYIWTAKYSIASPTLLEMISDSEYIQATT